MTIKGSVFHIIHGSFVDGYGIRTTVFLKGCPLKCIWCCNPEGQAFNQELKVIAADCNGCGNCVSACPHGAIQLEKEQDDIRLDVDRKLCTNCGKCIDVCYTNALSFFGKDYTVDELFNIIQKDAIFYRSSEGGVTIGGGEATWQPEFTLALIRKCKENYIHTAVDTCGYVTSADGRQALAEADLILFDLKGMDSQQHLKNTGAPNEIILENLKNLNDLGKEIIIRVPVIPGYTDSQQNLTATAAFLATLKSVARVDILPVHQFGKVKYSQIGMEYKLVDIQLIPQERQEQIKMLFESYGLNAQIGG
ncbi:glycyl-radical enzyme activating protein [Sporomusa aerivorans]|uniref:glycyl-radical enzyme activating protein n=1 Tax=Sporomusa aerivorans TaxID=204936 RepID=UPI00352A7BB3